MKKYKDYLIISAIVLATFIIIFIAKGVFPFGNSTIAFSDMQAQIIDFYYHFRNSVYGSGSLLIDFNTSWGVNFYGQMVYYLMSPFTLIVLLVQRVDVYKCVSLITLCKFLTASLTSLYFFKHYFKKINAFGCLALSLMYTFCGYSLVLYQITSWMDLFYMFPLLVIGVKKIIDLEDTKWYLVTLTLCLIFSFYITFITLIYIFLISYIYLRIFKKENTKKAMTSLGIFTLLAFLLSAVTLIPTLIQIASSERTALYWWGMMNSQLGSLPDKLHYFLFSGVAYALAIRFVITFKKYKKEVKFFLLALLLLFIPVIIEPVHLLVHFGSYYSFPVRYGFIIFFALITAGAFFLEHYDKDELDYPFKNVTYFGIVIITFFVLYHTILNYYSLQYAVYSLSIRHIMIIFWVMLGALAFVVALFVLLPLLVPNRNRLCVYIFIFTSITSFGYAYNYIGIDKSLELNTKIQQGFIELSDDVYKDGCFSIKTTVAVNVDGGNVMNHPYAYSFTSLTESSNRATFKRLGYTLKPNVNSSVGGSYFTDSLLGYKYLISSEKIKDENYTKLSSTFYTYYENVHDISYGYIFDESRMGVLKEQSVFKNQNDIYHTWYDDNLFDVLTFNTKLDAGTIYESKLTLKTRKALYVELRYSGIAEINRFITGIADIYVNGKKIYKSVPNDDTNGIILLGTYDPGEVKVEVKIKATAEVQEFNIGVMDEAKWLKFVKEQKTPEYDIEFNNNMIHINIEEDEKGKVLFIPITYADEYHMTINGKDADIVKAFGGYIGVRLNKGENDIKITYISKGLVLSALITFITLILVILGYRFNIYRVLINNKILGYIAYIVYNLLYWLVIIGVFLIPIICFVISFFTYVQI